MITRYLDDVRCALIADALACLSPDTDDAAEIAEQLERIFRERSAPGTGFILTQPGESA
jgi:hypothetical protein